MKNFQILKNKILEFKQKRNTKKLSKLKNKLHWIIHFRKECWYEYDTNGFFILDDMLVICKKEIKELQRMM